MMTLQGSHRLVAETGIRGIALAKGPRFLTVNICCLRRCHVD